MNIIYGQGGGGGASASIFATGALQTDTCTLTTPNGQTKQGVWSSRTIESTTVNGFEFLALKEYGTYTLSVTRSGQTKTYNILIDASNEFIKQVQFLNVPLSLQDIQDAETKSITATFTYSYFSNGYGNTAGFSVIGRSSEGSSYGSYVYSCGAKVFEIDVTDLSTLSFYAKKYTNHGVLRVYCSNVEPTTSTPISSVNVIQNISYGSFPTTWTQYTYDISSLTGIYYFIFSGGYGDRTGNTTSQTDFSNIRFE